METMSQTRMPDIRVIGIEEDRELDYWSKKFGISKEELTEAVKAGETSTGAVEKFVQRVEFKD